MTRLTHFLTLLFALMLSSASLSANAQPKEFPVEDFFSNAVYNGVHISPDGRHFAIKSSEGSRDKIIIFDREQRKVTTSFAFGDNIRFSNINWVNNERIIFEGSKFVGFLDEKGGVPSLYGANVDGSNRRELFKWGRTGYRLLHLWPEDPEHILIGKFHYADDGEMKAHRMNVNDGRLYYLADQPPRANSLITDNSGELRAAYAYEEERDDEYGDGSLWLYYKPLGSAEWKEFDISNFEKGKNLSFGGFTEDERYAYLISDHDSKTTAIYKFDTLTGDMTAVADDPVSNVMGPVYGMNGAIVGFEFMPDYFRRVYVDDSKSAQLLKRLEASFPGQRVTLTSLTEDKTQAVVAVSSDRNAGEYYLFNTDTLEASYIASPNPKLNPADMAEVTPFNIEARDGLRLNGYLTIPQAHDEAQVKRLIVNVHGGPHGPFDRWGFSAENQFFANRGFAVLQVNFRGSGGYGQLFEEAGYRKWGREMQNDVTDATLWAIEQGYADKDHICIYGGSYGGYASMMGVIREPDLYQCAVGYVGVYSLPVMKTTGDIPGRESGRKYLSHVLGDDQAELQANSPAFNVDKIKAALYIVHGEDDVRVPMAQYEALTDALDKAKIPYQSMLRDEGHGFQLEPNKFDLYNSLDVFFTKHLGDGTR
ncbi:hypothetical protein IDSA_01310 [Pseudidiomarina salinarum]|uniref:Peptidase S9 prolyl oligopeptidase catalytic domain-containing protein n=1 Tax=Pseudidiomarina salinarum TaxID=435908 RepID=A0A094IWC3_9GAMM|nr:prolyl oligopeptidase family serine peptidase [Pseudidiomarina salinarum]KFZ31387.1 hypothetical protein IDSA_01310 [Pseudidiomarina salinarum]RUO70853.1 S9 family peptidase [Pseudidiomarina salinarum]